MVALTELWWQNSLWLWIRSCSSKCLSICQITNIHMFSRKTLTGAPSLSVSVIMSFKTFLASIFTTVRVSVTDGSSDYCSCSCCSHMLCLHQYSISASYLKILSSLRVWQVSAAEDGVNRFNSANVCSTLSERSGFDNKYKLINSALLKRNRTTKWNYVFDQVTTAHHFKHWYLFIKTSTLLIFFFFCKNVNQYKICMVIWETSSSLHKRKMSPGYREKFKIQQQKQPAGGNKTTNPPPGPLSLPSQAETRVSSKYPRHVTDHS